MTLIEFMGTMIGHMEHLAGQASPGGSGPRWWERPPSRPRRFGGTDFACRDSPAWTKLAEGERSLVRKKGFDGLDSAAVDARPSARTRLRQVAQLA